MSSSHSEPGSAPRPPQPKARGCPRDRHGGHPPPLGAGHGQHRAALAQRLSGALPSQPLSPALTLQPLILPAPAAASPAGPSGCRPLAAPQPCPHLAVPQRSHGPTAASRFPGSEASGGGAATGASGGCRVRAESARRRSRTAAAFRWRLLAPKFLFLLQDRPPARGVRG